MAVSEESVHVVKTKRLKKELDVSNVTCVKCSPDSSCLLVGRKDSSLDGLFVKTGETYFVCDEVRDFIWSYWKDLKGKSKEHFLAVVHIDGSVEVFQLNMIAADKTKPGKYIVQIGLITLAEIIENIEENSLDKSLRALKLLDCQQVFNEHNEETINVTLLLNGYRVAVLSFAAQQLPLVVKSCEIIKNIDNMPFLLPQQTIADVTVAKDNLFILYQSGMIVVYNSTNLSYCGWIDAFQSTEDMASEGIEQQTVKRPNAMHLGVDEKNSFIFVCDERNYVTKINFGKYIEDFPENITMATHIDGALKDRRTPKTFGNVEFEQCSYDDPFWEMELSRIALEYENETIDTHVKLPPQEASQSSVVTSTQPPCSLIIPSPPWMSDCNCEGVFTSHDSHMVWLQADDTTNENHGTICCWLDWRKEYVAYVFQERTIVVSGGLSTKPLYLLTNNSIGSAVFDNTQNELVNKIIIYENVAMAEKLCFLNEWDHFAVPISALESALKHRQLETVAFYLKTKGKAFTITVTEHETAMANRLLSPQSPPATFSFKQLISTKESQTADLAEQIKAVMDLLMNTIAASSKRKHSVQFTSQLLQLSSDYVHGLIQDALSYIEQDMGSDVDRTHAQDILIYLTEKMMELRSYKYTIPEFKGSQRENSQTEVDDLHDAIFDKWSTMDYKDVVSDAICSSQISLVQVYFLSQMHSNETHDGSLECILETGLQIVLEILTKRDIATATEMIRNMGKDVVQLIRKISFSTFNRPLRDFLLEQLQSWGELREDEMKSVEYLVRLETIYDNPSFESFARRRSQQHEFCFDDLGLLQRSLDSNGEAQEKSIEEKTGSLAPQYHPSESTFSGGYSEVVLDWVLTWDDITRDRILLEALCHDEEALRAMIGKISQKSLWQYLTAHCEIERITEWIEKTARGSSEESMGYPSLSFETRSDLTECTEFARELILDELVKCKLFSRTLLQDFPLLIRHLARTNCLFAEVHPLHDVAKTCGSCMELESGSKTVTSVEIFHQRMIEYCSENDIVIFLYYYLDYYRLFQTIDECNALLATTNVDSAVEMLLRFRLVGFHPSDYTAISSMSFSNSKTIFKSDTSSLTEMLERNRPIMAMATCLYAPVDIAQIVKSSGQNELEDAWQVDERLLKNSLNDYPGLLSALFPTSRNLTQDPDITLYELLQGNCSFDISSLFKWQSTNKLAVQGGSSTEMPHFSNKPLVEKFGHEESLSYVYYLKHGRPGFAFATFMDKYEHRKTIPKSSKRSATRKAYEIAITHFDSTRIVSSCVAFLELLSVNSIFLRIDVAAARRCLHPGNKQELHCATLEELRGEIAGVLLKCASDKKQKPEILIKILESSTRSLISKDGLERTSREASHYWTLPLLFCRSHNLSLTPVFLIDCAVADKWLSFLTHAQFAQFPKTKVLGIIRDHFSNPVLKEHMHHVVANTLRVDVQDTETKKRRTNLSSGKKDIRSQYLSRVIGASVSPTSKQERIVHAPEIKQQTAPVSPNAEKEQFDLEFDLDSDYEEALEDEVDFDAPKINDINPETSPDNLFDVLTLCDEVKDSWRAILAHSIVLRRPLFAILAACYEEAKMVDCMCVWFCSVLERETLNPVTQHISDLEWHHWTLDDLLSLILTISSHGYLYVYTLSRAFYLFDPNNILLPFMRFFEASLMHKDFEAAACQLSEFVVQHKWIQVNDSSKHKMVIRDLSWCERVACGVLQNILRSCDTIFMQVEVAKLLCHCKFGNSFAITVPDFKKLYEISRILDEGEVFAQCLDLVLDETKRSLIMDKLIQRKRFDLARQYGTLMDISCDRVTIMQITYKKQSLQTSCLWQNQQERIAFWENCDRFFVEQACSTAGQFFEEQAKESCISDYEKATLLYLALKWHSGKRPCCKMVPWSSEDLAKLECEMWLCVINSRMSSSKKMKGKIDLNDFNCYKNEKNFAQERHVSIDVNFSHLVHDEQMQAILKDMLGELLDMAQISQARRLSQLFDVYTVDLHMVLTCIFLAQEIITPDDIDEEIKAQLAIQRQRKLSDPTSENYVFVNLSQSLKSTSSFESSSTALSDNLDAIQNLAQLCTSGKICCIRVIVAYKICQTLTLGFNDVVKSEPIRLLYKLLDSTWDCRYQLASQYIRTFDLDVTMVAKFVAHSITMSLQVDNGTEILTAKVCIFNTSSKDDMNNMISLAESKLILGGLLFDEALKFARQRKEQKTLSVAALKIEVELLIIAHHCQTLACNMEGISSVLRLAQLCTRALADAKEYQQMVRLLTGIGRFSEMTYIFQTLLEHHHFELLVRKGVENENKLKIALLKFLDKYHLEDTEKHLMVAYRFNMHREVALSFTASAELQIRKLLKKGLVPSNEVRTQLASVAQTYTYAMEYFKREGCLLQAMECAKKHRLIELQKQLLPTGMVILDLKEKSFKDFLTKYNNFFEAFIVADAYDKRSFDVWIEPLFHHVILKGDTKYLNEMLTVVPISNEILSELVRRYRTELQRNSTAIANMKKVLRRERDMISRYKIAVDLGYHDEIRDLRTREAGALILDKYG